MTIKELASFCGKSDKTVRRWVHKAGQNDQVILDKMSKGGETGTVVDFTIDEVELILQSGFMSKDAVNVIMQNARGKSQSVTKSSDDRILTILETLTNQNQVLASMIQNQDRRIANLENNFGLINNQIEQRKALLPPAQITPKKHIENLINIYAREHNEEHRVVRSRLYREFDLRYHHHSSQSAKKAGITTIAWIESIDKVQELEAVAIEMFA